MGALTNCCSSKKKTDHKKDDDLVDLNAALQQRDDDDKDITTTEEPEERLEDMMNEVLFRKTDLMQKYMEDNLEPARDNVDQFGYLTFEYFLKVYKCALIWNRASFAEKKKELIEKRRTALEKGNMVRYGELIQLISDADEATLQDVLVEVLKFIDMNDKKFTESFSFHTQDPEKYERVAQVQEETAWDNGEDLEPEEREKFINRPATMTKAVVMDAQKANQNISIELINQLKKLPPAEVQDEIRFLKFKCVDLLYIGYNIDSDELIFNTWKLKMEDDEDYKNLLDTYNKKMENLQKA